MSIPPQPTPPAAPVAAETGDATGGVIPYKNPCALVGYYLGVFSVIPIIGFFLGIGAFILGIIGLRTRKRHPVVRGTVHAWVGIIVGGLSVLVHLGFVAMMCWAVFKTRH